MFKERKAWMVLWGVAAAACLWLYQESKSPVQVQQGLVEVVTFKASPTRGGEIQEVRVRVGDKVARGDVLFVMKDREAEAEWNLLREELRAAEDFLQEDRKLTLQEREARRLELRSRVLSLEGEVRDRRASQRGILARVKKLDQEIQRLEKANQEGLGRSPQLAEMALQRTELQERRVGEREVLKSLQARLDDARGLLEAFTRGDEGAYVRRHRDTWDARKKALERRASVLRERLRQREVVASGGGRVVEVGAQAGEVVDGVTPVVEILSSGAEHADLFLPDRSSDLLQEGMVMEITPQSRPGESTRGRVVFVQPGVESIPQFLFLRPQERVHRARIVLDEGHSLKPGERISATPLRVELQAAEPHQRSHAMKTFSIKDALEVDVPQELQRRTALEISGALWLQDLSRFLVVSDDTDKDDSPWLFLVDKEGNVDPNPVVVEGLDAVKDLEALAEAPDGALYLVASQNPSKKGKLPASRQILAEVRREGRTLRLVRSLPLASVLKRDLSASEKQELGFFAGLDIEGAAWDGEDLLLGIKSSADKEGLSLLWRLKQPSKMLEEGKIQGLSVERRLDLKQETLPGGISGLEPSSRGLLVASSVPDVSKKDLVGALHLLEKDGSLRPLARFPGGKPEGLALFEGGEKVRVFFDRGSKASRFVDVEVP